jgi:hypothetical protein
MANNPLSQVTQLLGGSSTRTSSAGGSGSGGSDALTQQLTTITTQLQQLQTVNQTQMETLEANTTALSQNTSAKGSSSGSSTASTIGSTLENVFGLGLSPLISGLVSLFGGGGSSQPAPLVPYVAPASIQANAGISSASSGAFAVDTADGGLPRPVPAPGSGSSSSSSTSSSATTQITVQVQALDSQSFLDHSDDIAAAVRQAMLTSTTLNDVIRSV